MISYSAPLNGQTQNVWWMDYGISGIWINHWRTKHARKGQQHPHSLRCIQQSSVLWCQAPCPEAYPVENTGTSVLTNKDACYVFQRCGFGLFRSERGLKERVGPRYHDVERCQWERNCQYGSRGNRQVRNRRSCQVRNRRSCQVRNRRSCQVRNRRSCQVRNRRNRANARSQRNCFLRTNDEQTDEMISERHRL